MSSDLSQYAGQFPSLKENGIAVNHLDFARFSLVFIVFPRTLLIKFIMIFIVGVCLIPGFHLAKLAALK